jgi:hypothetical protein
VRDVDADGDDDVMAVDASQFDYYELVLGDPSRTPTMGGTWIPGVLNVASIAIGQFDGDGLFDVAAGSDGYSNAIAVSHTDTIESGTTVYCVAKKNSLQCTPQLGFEGTPSASASSGFLIEAHDVLSNKNGLFYYSLVGPNQVAFLGGTYCVKPPTKRTALQNAGGNPPPVDCSGVFAFDFNAWMAGGQDANLTPGTTVWGQFWSRDTGFAAPNNVGLTGGIRFTILP